jgi:2-polyprenyl-3-methyl-5-hydroxy-6-metoxy-1,4-benzoquinol methylase
MNAPPEIDSSVTPREFTVSKQERHHRYLMPVILQRLASLPSDARVLDLGCGSGYICGQLASRGYEVAGVDASNSGIAVARAAIPHVQFCVDSLQDLSVKDKLGGGEFDAIVSTEVIEHLYSPAQFLMICRGLLKPSGLLVITTPYHGYLKNLLMALSGKLERHFQPGSEGGHIRFWSKATLSRVLMDHGFHVTHFDGCGRIPWLWKSMVLTSVSRPG